MSGETPPPPDAPAPLLAPPSGCHLLATLSLGAAFLGFFYLVYGGTYWLTGLHARRLHLAFDFEAALPFVPAAAAVYLSILLMYALIPFVLRTWREIVPLYATLAAETAVGGLCFLLLPVAQTYPPRTAEGAFAGLFGLADALNLDHNELPSLHVAFAWTTALALGRRGGAAARALFLLWASAVAASTLLMHEHHLADVLAGLALGAAGMAIVHPRVRRWCGRGRTPAPAGHRVAIVTGGLISGKERSLGGALRKWLLQRRFARAAWLDFKIKLVTAEPLVAGRLERAALRFGRRRLSRQVEAFFADPANLDTPPLTEVVLASLLRDAGVPYRTLALDDLFAAPAAADRILAQTDCVFLSSTLLHDLSELIPLVRRLKRPHNRIVVGGALAGVLHDRWEGAPEVDVLAIGYGEMLVPALADWVRSGFETLRPPAGGALVRKAHTRFLYSGVPAGKSLDFLPRPDWGLVAVSPGRATRMIYYESVRGCPYRCSFCNYPYLFADTEFRYRSAARMADDWEHYVGELGVTHVTCLDSLFTVPRQRLSEFCRLLIERAIRVEWICYARADDLADAEVVALLKRAGVHHVQIGIESGDPDLLRNMNKKCSVEANARALANCREHGLTTVVSLIVGYPGETEASLERTYRFLEATPPDFYFLAAFSTRVANVPILEPRNRRRFGLEVVPGLYTMAPYWRHATMSCTEVGDHVRRLDHRIMANRVALNATLFYPGLLGYRPDQRAALLEFQRRVATRHPLSRAAFSVANRLADRALRRDSARRFRAAAAAAVAG